MAPGLGLLLLPLGWGLLLGRTGGEANLFVEHEPQCSECVRPVQAGSVGAEEDVQHVLIFRAARDIGLGEPLFAPARGTTQLKHALPPTFDEARRVTSLLPSPAVSSTVERACGSPQVLQRLVFSAGQLVKSGVHGYGVFASKHLELGETVEFVPMLPLLFRDIASSRLRDYVVKSAFADVVLLPLGLGGMYNHRSVPNVSPVHCQDQPFLQAWQMQADVGRGSELFVSYGSSYWQAAWRGRPT